MELAGDVIIGGLVPVHQKSDTTENKCAERVSSVGYQSLAAILFALEEINSNSDILPNITLGTKIYDTCRSQTIGVDGAKQLVRYSLRNTTSPLVAVIGATRSDVSIPVANILRAFDIPQVSYLSTSPELSNKDIYSYFFRTISSDTFHAKAMVDVMKSFGWKYVLTVFSSGQFAAKGMEQFYKDAERANICIAEKIELKSFSTGDHYEDAIRQLVIAKKSFTKGQLDVVVLYCILKDFAGLMEAAQKLFQRDMHFTWISSEWNDIDIASEGLEVIVEGALIVNHWAGQVQRFNRFLLSRNPSSNNYSRWFEEFWQEVLNCDLSETSRESSRFPRKCTENDTIEANHITAPTHSVMNAVYAIAHALDDMRKDVCQTHSGLCSSMRSINGKDLLRYLRNVSFLDTSDNKPFRFDGNQEVDGEYVIYNYRRSQETGHYRAVQVGTWHGTATRNGQIQGRLNLNRSRIAWGGMTRDSPPQSYCSRECKSTQVRIPEQSEPECCWSCQDCGTRSIVTNNSCEACPPGYKASNNTCTEVPTRYPSWAHPAAKALILVTALGILVTIGTAAFYAVERGHPAIKAAGKELCVIMFLGILSCHVATLLYFLKPTDTLCKARLFAGTVSVTTCYAPILLRTSRIYRIFKSAQSSPVRPSFTSPRSQIAAACGLVAVQVGITLTWLLAVPPSAVQDYQHQDNTLLICSSKRRTMAITLAYNTILILISTVFAFKTRNFPQNFNEAKFITISMSVMCSVWLIFIPTYFSTTDAVLRAHLVSGMLLLVGATTLGGMLLPRVFVVLSGVISPQHVTSPRSGNPASTNAVNPSRSPRGRPEQPSEQQYAMSTFSAESLEGAMPVDESNDTKL